MALDETEPLLPLELILQVIEAVLPSHDSAIIPRKHSATKTLLTFTLVSRSTYVVASRLLRQRCVYLDSSRALGTFLRCIPRLWPSLPLVLSLKNITMLYLKPFTHTLDDQPIALWIRELFCEVCESLTRLVIDIPFASMDPFDDHLNVRKTLRDGFARLTKLEEFICIGDYPSLSMAGGETDIWRLWPELQRLVLFKVPMSNHWLWWNIATLPKLHTVIFPRPQRSKEYNIKDEYFRKLPPDDPLLKRKLRVMMVDTEMQYSNVPMNTTDWDEIDPDMWMRVELYTVPTAEYGRDDEWKLCSDWVRQAAVNGTLWEWEGDLAADAGAQDS
jgi:hypothetical protein